LQGHKGFRNDKVNLWHGQQRPGEFRIRGPWKSLIRGMGGEQHVMNVSREKGGVVFFATFRKVWRV